MKYFISLPCSHPPHPQAKNNPPSPLPPETLRSPATAGRSRATFPHSHSPISSFRIPNSEFRISKSPLIPKSLNPLIPSTIFMTHAPLAPSPHLWQINHCITSSVQPPKLSRRQPEEGLTVAWRKPNVSSDVRGHTASNRNPPSWCKEIQKP